MFARLNLSSLSDDTAGGGEKPFPSICSYSRSLLFPSESNHKTAEQQVRGKRTNENGHISCAKKNQPSGVEITNSVMPIGGLRAMKIIGKVFQTAK